MELISNLALGFSVSLHPINLFFGFAGVTLGVIIGILPGSILPRRSRCFCQ
jgi:putative tricarboxylic transport membrane protein